MKIGRRHEIPESETKNLIVRGTAGSMSLMFPRVPHALDILQE